MTRVRTDYHRDYYAANCNRRRAQRLASFYRAQDWRDFLCSGFLLGRPRKESK